MHNMKSIPARVASTCRGGLRLNSRCQTVAWQVNGVCGGAVHPGQHAFSLFGVGNAFLLWRWATLLILWGREATNAGSTQGSNSYGYASESGHCSVALSDATVACKAAKISCGLLENNKVAKSCVNASLSAVISVRELPRGDVLLWSTSRLSSDAFLPRN